MILFSIGISQINFGIKMALLCTEFSWVSNKCCWDKFGRGWSCRYVVWIAICFLNNRTLSFIPCSYISGHCFLVHRKCWYSLSINGDDQWCAPVSFFKIQKPCISHPKELQVVPNYAFPWKVYAEKKSVYSQVPQWRYHITDFTLNLDMLQGGDPWSSNY